MSAFAKGSVVYTLYPDFKKERQCTVIKCRFSPHFETGVAVITDKIQHEIDSSWYSRVSKRSAHS